MGESITKSLTARKNFSILIWLWDAPNGEIWKYVEEHFLELVRIAGQSLVFFVDPLTLVRQGKVNPSAFDQWWGVDSYENLEAFSRLGGHSEQQRYRQAITGALCDVSTVDTNRPVAFIFTQWSPRSALACRLDDPKRLVPELFRVAPVIEKELRRLPAAQSRAIEMLSDALIRAGIGVKSLGLSDVQINSGFPFEQQLIRLFPDLMIGGVLGRAFARFSRSLAEQMNGVPEVFRVLLLDALRQYESVSDEKSRAFCHLESVLHRVVRTEEGRHIHQLVVERLGEVVVSALQHTSKAGIVASEAFRELVRSNPELCFDLTPAVFGYLRALEIEQTNLLDLVAAGKCTGLGQIAEVLRNFPWPSALRKELLQLADGTRELAPERNFLIHRAPLQSLVVADDLRRRLGVLNQNGLIPTTIFAYRRIHAVINSGEFSVGHLRVEEVEERVQKLGRNSANNRIPTDIEQLPAALLAIYARSAIEKLGRGWFVAKSRWDRCPYIPRLFELAGEPKPETSQPDHNPG